MLEIGKVQDYEKAYSGMNITQLESMLNDPYKSTLEKNIIQSLIKNNGEVQYQNTNPLSFEEYLKNYQKTENFIQEKENPINSEEIKNSETEENGNEDIQFDLQKIWDREDAIRKETQEREDTAYQRAVADMRLAGINPNLTGVQPAQSGGGITNATTNESNINTQLQIIAQKAIAEIEKDVKLSEGEKNRATSIIASAIIAGARLLIKK